jgi:hypothetical protein
VANLYRYKCYSLLTKKYLGDIPLVNVTFTNMLNDAGGFTGTMPLPSSALTLGQGSAPIGVSASGGSGGGSGTYGDTNYGDDAYAGGDSSGSFIGGGLLPTQKAVVAADLISITQPGAVALYVERSDFPTGKNANLIWGGIIWTRTKQLSYQQQIDIGAKEFFSYMDQRYIGGAFNQSLYYVNADETFIAADIFAKMQSVPLGNINVDVPTQASSGQIMTATYYNYQFTKAGQAIRDLSALENGFDFVVDVAYGPGNVPINTFNTFFPQKGLTFNQTKLVIARPGGIMDYSWPEDATTMANVVTAVGAGTGTAMVYKTVSNVNPGGGLPVLEVINSYKQETVQANINARAASDLAVLGNPVVIPNLVIQANADPIVGTYSVGDCFLLKIADSRFSTPLSQYYRIISITTQPQDNGINEQVTLTLSQNLSV